MQLKTDEQRMLDGSDGRAKQRAMELLVEYGTALGAESFVDTNNVHLLIGFHFYPEVLTSRLDVDDIDMLVSQSVLNSNERIVVDRVAAFTTMHITTMDLQHWDLQQASRDGDPFDFRKLVVGIEEYCKRIGVAITSTCGSYEVGNIPMIGEHCAWTESSSIAFCNSVLGARTNIDGDHSSFASALTGKTPLWGYHLDAYRKGSYLVEVEAQPRTVQDWDLLGYFVGFRAGNKIPVFTNIQRKADMFKLMVLSASISVTGAVNMFHIVGRTPEAVTLEQATGGRAIRERLVYGEAERKQAYEGANTAKSDSVDFVVIGCPHYNPERLSVVTRLLEGRAVSSNVKLLIFTSTQGKDLARRSGWLSTIEKAGAYLVTDSCPQHTKVPVSSVVATDSAKISHQSGGEKSWESVWCGTTEECIDAALAGTWRGKLA